MAEAAIAAPGSDEEDALAQAAFIADWFSGLFIAPLKAGAIEAYRAGPGAALLDEIGRRLEHENASRRMNAILCENDSATVAADLGQRYTWLFEGIAGNATLALYESGYTGDGRRLFQQPVTAMQGWLDYLGMTVFEDCAEPCDHLSIELAALADALQRGDGPAARALHARLAGWVPRLARDLARDDPWGFYGAAATLLAGFLSSIRLPDRSLTDEAGVRADS